ncbi:MAG TPA: hypothetical protein VN578_11020 [Candidatus Binatia bacterium]|jgi:hypothetical protein|nr:hypothetical protein [Candidatus Binatia bacterium]
MTTNELALFVNAIREHDTFSLIQFIVLLLVSGVGAAIGAYLVEKGKNRATKEDVSKITSQIESVKTEFRLVEKKAENAFALSATSHMANTAFDKHIEFCEKYAAEMDKGLSILIQKGTTVEALEISVRLFAIRRQFVLWVPKDVGARLDKLEAALRRVGADEHLLPHLPVGEKRSKLVHELLDLFSKITTIEDLPDKPAPELAHVKIIEGLRDILGVEKLTQLRNHFFDQALSAVRETVQKCEK